jgi:N-acetyl-anhydromuramyl-L-alanine amidase AmpD
MVGLDAYTPEAWQALASLVRGLQKSYPAASVCGHRDFSPDTNKNGRVDKNEWLKTGPGFEVAAWLKADMQPLPAHIWEPKNGN